MLYGRKDANPADVSYVKTLFLTLVFVPILAISSYRVIDAPGGGWYFVGKTRLSAFARNWNYLVLLVCAAFAAELAWQSHISSDEYVAQELLTQAAELETKGEVLPAGKLYGRLLLLGKPQAECDEAATRLTQLICDRAKECSGEDQLALLRSGFKHITKRADHDRIAETGMQLVQQQREKGHPCLALDLFELVAAKDKNQAENEALHEEILRECTASEKVQMKHVDALAVILEKRGATAELERLLAPHAGELGKSESARMLGDIYFAKGDLAKAEAFLTPYVNGRLEAFRKAEKRYADACEGADKASLKKLREGQAGQAWYDRYDASNEQAKQAMVDQYISADVKRNRSVVKALATLQKEVEIVPFVMDLAVTKLQLARGRESVADRERTLKEAEELFLAVQGVAGEDEGFRISLGQVKYWLGKNEEGKELFDQALAQGEHRPELLSRVAEAMRQVGRREEAKRLVEEAYEKGNKEEKRHAAGMRAVMFQDTDDRILWLERTESDSPGIRASLMAARADKAETEGRLAAAEASLQEADRLYQSMPVDSASLNNRALVQGRLFALTASPRYADGQVAMLEQSETLNPTHTVIKQNLAAVYPDRMAARFMLDKADYRLLRTSPEFSHVSLLAKSLAERDAILASPVASEDLRKLREVAAKLQLLAPEAQTGFVAALTVCDCSRSADDCRELVGALAGYAGEPERERSEQEKALNRADQLAANGKRLALLQEALAKDGSKASPITQALLRCEISYLLQSNFGLGAETDNEEVVKPAAEAYSIHPSLYTENGLRNADYCAALHTLVQENEQAARIWAKCQDDMDIEDACLWMLYSDPKLKQKLLADRHFQQVAELYRIAAARGQREQGVRQWLVLSNTQPELAAEVAQTVAKNEFEALQAKACLLLFPHNASMIAYEIWRAQATGDAKEAERLLTEARAKGIAL